MEIQAYNYVLFGIVGVGIGSIALVAVSLKTGVPAGPYAEHLSEVPPVGRRRIRARIVKVVALYALLITISSLVTGIVVVFLWNPSEAPVWLGVVWAVVGAVYGAAIVHALFDRLLLARELRILSRGTPVEGQITGIVEAQEEGPQEGSISYQYGDPSGGQLREYTVKEHHGEKVGDLVVVFVDPDDPRGHLLLRRSFYRLLKDPV